MDTIKLLDVVALTEDLPEHSLRRGEVGTVAEVWAPGVFEVEFSDNTGVTYALASIRAEQLMPLYYRNQATDTAPEAA